MVEGSIMVAEENVERIQQLSYDGKNSTQSAGEGITYRVEYRHAATQKIVYQFDTDRLAYDLEENDQSRRDKIFDIVTTFTTSESEIKDEAGSGDTRRTPLVTNSRGMVSMHIHSKAIINALRSVVEYYPGQDLLGQTIVIPYPFAILVHHEKELGEFREKCNPSKRSEDMCSREKDAYNHLKKLLDFLEETIMPEVRAEAARNARGVETFEMLWVQLKPGKTIKFVEGGDLNTKYGAVIHSLRGGTFDNSDGPWSINYWILDYDGSHLGQCRGSIFEQRFNGETKIDSFVIDNSAFDDPLDESVKELVDRGKKFFDLLSKKCQYYKGPTLNFPHHQVDGLVMVDMKSYYLDIDSRLQNPTKPHVTFTSREKSWVSDCSCPVCKQRKEQKTLTKKVPFVDYNGIFPEDEESLTPHQYFLLPQKLWGFVFKTRTWEELDVTCCFPPKFEQGMIDKLVMDPERTKTLKSLAGSYIRQNRFGEVSKLPPWRADFVQGKGQGLIFLLHGKPGVGKTYTAECIAEYTQRPLMVLTSSDIGTSPERVEEILMQQFKTASSWGAVLLIDEADIFMERRSTNDLNRNSLVAGFLRALEFYDGILFLTTNRVGFFDDAFISRIHIQLYYPDFNDDDRRKVWQTFMDKLKKERGSSIRLSIEAKEYIAGSQIKEVKWNGREIRNAFQTAVALAEYEAEKDEEGKILVKDTHLSSIVALSRDFKKYLDELHQGDEEKRATREHARLGGYDQRTQLST